MTPDAALSSQATDVDKRLAQQASRLWNEIVQRRYDYGRPWRTARRLRKVHTREQRLASPRRLPNDSRMTS